MSKQKEIINYISVAEAAERIVLNYRGKEKIGCSVRNIYKLIHNKNLDFMKVGSVYLLHKDLIVKYK